jgi:glycosyltransferase involved in cell wall biosynthesis
LVIPIRDNLAEKAIEYNVSKEKVKVIPHDIDLNYFNRPSLHNIHQLFSISLNSKIISFAGRINKENYVDVVINIGKILARKRSDFEIIMMGVGIDEDRIKKIISFDPSIKKHFTFTGFQSREVCLDLHRSSDVSLCLMAGFSIIEDCAVARPFISYDVEWHSELVKNKETGFLLKENDVDGVVDSIDCILEHPEKINIIRQKAKAFAFEHHDLKITSDIKIKCYTEILSQGDDH